MVIVNNLCKESYCMSSFQSQIAPGMAFMPGTDTPAGLSQNLTSVVHPKDGLQSERNE
jgi:hypothetical protein